MNRRNLKIITFVFAFIAADIALLSILIFTHPGNNELKARASLKIIYESQEYKSASKTIMDTNSGLDSLTWALYQQTSLTSKDANYLSQACEHRKNHLIYGLILSAITTIPSIIGLLTLFLTAPDKNKLPAYR